MYIIIIVQSQHVKLWLLKVALSTTNEHVSACGTVNGGVEGNGRHVASQ